MCGPLPEWARVVLAARYLRATPWELMAQDEWQFWVEAAMLMRGIDSEQAERARKAKP